MIPLNISFILYVVNLNEIFAFTVINANIATNIDIIPIKSAYNFLISLIVDAT